MMGDDDTKNPDTQKDSDLLNDLERLQAALTQRQLDPHFPPLILERVRLTDAGELQNAADGGIEAPAESAGPDAEALPLLDEVVHQPHESESRSQANPFLSTKTLESLMAKRSEAEARALSSLIKPPLQAGLSKTAAAQSDLKAQQAALLKQLVDEVPDLIEQAIAQHAQAIEHSVYRLLQQRAQTLGVSLPIEQTAPTKKDGPSSPSS